MRLERRPLTGWTLREAGGGPTYPAEVPGSVHLDLLRAGVIPDPHYGTNELEVQWVGERDWVYRAAFTLAAERGWAGPGGGRRDLAAPPPT